MMEWLSVLDLLEAFITAFVVASFAYIALDILFGVIREYGEE